MTSYVSVDLRRFVIERADERCEYCLIHQRFRGQTHEIDHIIAEKHRGRTIESNLCFCCIVCNRNKGSDIASVDPQTEESVFLFHPRLDVWTDHFGVENGYINGLTAKGRATSELLAFNRPKLVSARRELALNGLYP